MHKVDQLQTLNLVSIVGGMAVSRVSGLLSLLRISPAASSGFLQSGQVRAQVGNQFRTGEQGSSDGGECEVLSSARRHMPTFMST